MSSDDSLLRVIVVIIAIVILLPMLMMLFMWPMAGAWGGHMGPDWMGNGAGWAWMSLFGWLVLFLVLIGGAYVLVRTFSRADAAGADPALEELKVAYARGDLTDEEFEQRRERLQELE